MTRKVRRNKPRPQPFVPVEVEVAISSLDRQGRGTALLNRPDLPTPPNPATPPHPATPLLVHVPFTLPGETIRARLWNEGPADGEADLLEIISPAPERIPPPCPLYGVCAGCQLQHLSYAAQLEWKTDVVRQLMAPLGLCDAVRSCVGSPRQFGYRSKITPHHDYPRPGQPLAIGFLKVGRRHEVVDVSHCPLATEGINARLPEFRAEIRTAASARTRGASFLVREAASGVTTDPDARVTERVGALELEFFAREFFQNNPFLLPRLVAVVVDAAAAGGANVLIDAYAGSGLFALSAAPRFRNVIAVEISPGAVEAARANAYRNGIVNARFLAADATRIFAHLDTAGDDAAVIVDPPRKGCGPQFLDQLVAFGPRTVVYVSCNPETMARDLGHLMAAGYGVIALQPFDMFPQTRHVECVAVLGRSGASVK